MNSIVRSLSSRRLLLVAAVLSIQPALADAPPLEGDDRAFVVELTSGRLDVRREAVGVPADMLAQAGPAGEGVYLVKFPGPVTAEQRDALTRQAERVYTYLPHDAFLVRLGAGGAELARSAGASWAGLFHPAYKISPRIAGVAADGQAKKPVMVTLLPDSDLDRAIARVEALGVEADEIVGKGAGERFSRLRLVLPEARIAALRAPLARLSEVFWIELEGRRVLLNDTTSWVGQTGTTGGQATPVYSNLLFGEGQVVGIVDTGIDPDMCFFRDLTLGLPPINPCDGGTLADTNQRKVIAVNFLWSGECSGGIGSNEWDTHDHGSHVAGTVAGDNFANPGVRDAADGMAPAAKLVIQDGGILTDNCADLPGLGCPVVDLNPIFQQAYTQGARLHTNSWGDRENFFPHNTYSAGTEDADEFMWNHKDFLLFFAAGNDGPGNGTVASPSTGKNVVSVGSTQRGASAESLSSFSSWGPTDDGRIKPDVTIPGSSIISANSDNNTGSNNCDTRSMSGTSMASPGATGLGALVRQYYTDGFYPSGAETLADAFTPSAALVKATLINSARQMTGASSTIPANNQGWGRIALDDALFFPAETRKLWIEDDSTGFPTGGGAMAVSVNFEVLSTAETFKATLTWTDFPSTPVASNHLVNDLDLEVLGPGGTFLGNVFSAGQSTTGGSADRVNSVEQVLIGSPPLGVYTVTVRAFNVPSGPQPWALVVTGDLAPAPPPEIFADGFESGDTAAWSATTP